MTFKKLLVPMDFSPCAKNAYKTALSIARTCDSSIELLTVAQVAQIHAIGTGAIVQPILSDYYEQFDEQFEELLKEIPPEDITVNKNKSTATLRDAIFGFIETGNIDLIVMGTKSEHDLLEQFLGSHSADIVGVSKVPVLVIPEKCDKPHFNTIGVAVDYKHLEGAEILAPVRDFANAYGSKVHILNVSKAKERLFVHDDQKVAVSNHFSGLSLTYHTYSDQRDITEILLDSINEHQLDMLFMLPQNHSAIYRLLHTSKSKSMAMKVEVPLMTIHE